MTLVNDITITDKDSNTYSGAVSDISIENYKVNLNIILTLSDAETIRGKIYPGKFKKLDMIDQPWYIDTTYASGNTLGFSLTGGASNVWSGGNLVIESYTKEPIGRPPTYALVKISGYEVTSL